MRKRIIMLGAGLAAAALGASAPSRAGGDKIAFPAGYDAGILYATVERPDIKQYRELYVSPVAALKAAREGQPLPDGTVLTLVQYKAVLGPDGNPAKTAEGRFQKGELAGYAVMEKRAGWGAEYPPEIRNGEWEYQSFTPARAVNDKANLAGCFQCHKPLDRQDFVFSYDRLKAFGGM